jgi:hypothetical protein
MSTSGGDTSGLIKPFTATVNAAGIATVNITMAIHGLAWIVYQIGFGLGIQASSPQVAAHVNGTPLAATVAMQVSAFASITGQAPYAMETFFVGPPYVTLEAGDSITCAVIGATSGDIFTASAYVNEVASPAGQRAKAGYARS